MLLLLLLSLLDWLIVGAAAAVAGTTVAGTTNNDELGDCKGGRAESRPVDDDAPLKDRSSAQRSNASVPTYDHTPS